MKLVIRDYPINVEILFIFNVKQKIIKLQLYYLDLL